ncbi:hypothetical protein [Novosphingobium sp. AP12]|uniref:hypothetical protein n=1 Tax=Novosphingobium sp. AP12 TaxID=1144305 RepID=UPI0012FB7AA9|nr:hypothetical protein [Novosphingobium sp. AP12]
MRAPAMERWSLASRVLAGTLGAYALTALLTAALSVLLIQFGVDPVEAATGATISSFAVFTVAAMAVFHARSVMKAWVWLALIGAACGMVVLLLGAQ